jgi:Glycosyl transferase family group 2
LLIVSGLAAGIGALCVLHRLDWAERPSSLDALAQLFGISVVGVRLVTYFHSFTFHWKRYRSLREVSTAELKSLNVPYVKVHVTTRGLPGSTEVILRGIRNVAALVAEDTEFYGELLSVEICTESQEQARLLLEMFRRSPLSVSTVVIPEEYRTSAGTLKKARSLQYMVEKRRSGWGRRPGKTFIVHYDEESVIEPGEMRKLLRCLSTTDKKILEGPIYYPLEYTSASILCRTMEANRPMGCFECRSVMESGIPLHLHGSNLVVEEQFENAIGWDMGTLDGQAFIAEDYVFGVLAFLMGGRKVFGWHGVAMLEQPPFSYHSAFKQRQRWITGVLQGQQMLLRMREFWGLPAWLRLRLIWGTRFRMMSFAIGTPVGVMFVAYLGLVVAGVLPSGLFGRPGTPLPVPLMMWLSLVALLWLGSVFIGAWFNLSHTGYPLMARSAEISKVMTMAPIAGIGESAAGLWAIACWLSGHRQVSWHPTPKTVQADLDANWKEA